MKQLDLFAWAESRPTAQVIDAMPALIKKAAFEVIYKIPAPKETGKVIRIERTAA